MIEKLTSMLVLTTTFLFFLLEMILYSCICAYYVFIMNWLIPVPNDSIIQPTDIKHNNTSGHAQENCMFLSKDPSQISEMS